MKTKIKCYKCRIDNFETDKFCIECGVQLQKNCIKCKTLQPQYAKFCGECGNPFEVKKEEFVEKSKQIDLMPLNEAEIKLIKIALRETSGVQTKAAKLLGISERALRYKIKEKGIDNYII
jgi:DNA-binding NtrC family response regulator